MERLYSPWRSQYIEGLEKSEGCFLCKAYQENNDEKNLLLYRGERAFVILNGLHSVR